MHENIHTIAIWQAREVSARPIRPTPESKSQTSATSPVREAHHPDTPPSLECPPDLPRDIEGAYRRRWEGFVERGEAFQQELEDAANRYGEEAEQIPWQERPRVGDRLEAAFQPTLPERYHAASYLLQAAVAILRDNTGGAVFLAEHPDHLTEKLRVGLTDYGLTVQHAPTGHSAARVHRNRLIQMREKHRGSPDR